MIPDHVLRAETRQIRYAYELLDSQLGSKGFLDGVLIGGSLAYDLGGDVKRTGQISLVQASDLHGQAAWRAHSPVNTVVSDDIDFGTDRLRVYMQALDVHTGEWHSEVLGTFFMAVPERETDSSSIKTTRIELADVGQNAVVRGRSARVTFGATRQIVPAVRDLLDMIDTPHVISDDGEELTLGEAKSWDIGTSILETCNDALTAIGYEPLWFTAGGIAVSAPWVAAEDLQPTKQYLVDSTSILSPEIKVSNDLADIPNRWVLTATTETQDELVAVHSNRSVGRTSWEARGGRWVTDFHAHNGPITTQAALNTAARRRAEEMMGSEETITFKTAAVPHGHREILAIEDPTTGQVHSWEETRWSLTMEPGAYMDHEARRVMPVDSPVEEAW